MNARNSRLVVCGIMVLAAAATAGAGGWTEQAKLVAADPADHDYFGRAVDVCGDYAIVGAYQDDDSGSAYVYQRTGETWSQVAKLTANDGAAGDSFGYSVSISGDYAIVGAIADDDRGDRSGSAYVFHRSGSAWNQVAKLIGTDTAVSDGFGSSVSIDGDCILVGAFWDDTYGSAYVFQRSGSAWNQMAKIVAPDRGYADRFGRSVSLCGGCALIGAHGDLFERGSAHVFSRSGSTWNHVARLRASDGTYDDNFGAAVALCGDLAVIGMPSDKDPVARAGSAYIFEYAGGAWQERTKLNASDYAADDYFGSAVAIGEDCAIIGAYGDDDLGSCSGAAYLFEPDGAGWSESFKFTGADTAGGDYFGYAVAMDGNDIIVGAHGDADCGWGTGAAYLFVPEPVTMGLLALAGLAILRRRAAHACPGRG